MDIIIDQEFLISLVRDRPVIWDNTTAEYKNKRLKYDAWKEICKKLKPNLEDIDIEGKIDFEKLVIKKWTNMKDNWIKYRRKVNKCKSGPRISRKYLHYDKMLFLEKFVEHRQAESTINQSDSNDETSQNGDNTEYNLKESEGSCESPKIVENKKDQLIERYESSRSMNFFRGIAPTVDKFNDESMIDFQFQVISVIKNIRQREQAQNIAPLSQRTTAAVSSNMKHQKHAKYGCPSADKAGSRSKLPRTETNDQLNLSLRQPSRKRSYSNSSVKVSNEDSEELSHVDHAEYFDLSSSAVGAYPIDDEAGDVEIEEPIIKIEIVEDSVEPEGVPNELLPDEIKPEPSYDSRNHATRRSNSRQKRKNRKVLEW